jgi:hypothetical protein
MNKFKHIGNNQMITYDQERRNILRYFVMSKAHPELKMGVKERSEYLLNLIASLMFDSFEAAISPDSSSYQLSDFASQTNRVKLFTLPRVEEKAISAMFPDFLHIVSQDKDSPHQGEPCPNLFYLAKLLYQIGFISSLDGISRGEIIAAFFEWCINRCTDYRISSLDALDEECS